MPIDAFVSFTQRLSDVDYTDLFGERTEQLQEIRKDALKELAKRLNSDLPRTDREIEQEAAFFKELKKKLGSEDTIGSTSYWQNRVQPKKLRAMYSDWADCINARSSQGSELLSQCKSADDVIKGLRQIPSNKDLMDRAKVVTNEALEALALSNSYSEIRDEIVVLFKEIKTFEQIIEDDLGIYDSAASAVGKWIELEAAKASAAAAKPAVTLFDQTKALFGGVAYVVKHPTEIPRAIWNHPWTALGATLGTTYALPRLIGPFLG